MMFLHLSPCGAHTQVVTSICMLFLVQEPFHSISYVLIFSPSTYAFRCCFSSLPHQFYLSWLIFPCNPLHSVQLHSVWFLVFSSNAYKDCIHFFSPLSRKSTLLLQKSICIRVSGSCQCGTPAVVSVFFPAQYYQACRNHNWPCTIGDPGYLCDGEKTQSNAFYSDLLPNGT